MANLFIIGNGFDISHDIKTSYEDFHQYLINNYPNASDNIIPWSTTMPDESERYDSDEVVSIIMKVINETDGQQWSNLEHSLGLLELSEFLDDYIYESDDDDFNEWHEVYRNEDKAKNLSGVILEITQYFDRWIQTINVSSVKSKFDFNELIDIEKDYFLTFNYTTTLEVVYNVQKICHIHGKQGEKLYFGHGNDEDNYNYYMANHIGSENALSNMQRILRKNTTEALLKNKHFFDDLKDIDKIYSFGFSFSEVDNIYIKEICKNITTKNVVWNFNDFNSKARRNELATIVKACGFNGRLGSYHVS